MNTAANEQVVRSFFAHLATGQAEACLAQITATCVLAVQRSGE